MGYCDFDEETIPRIYIHKVNSEDDNFFEKFSVLLSNVEKLFDGIGAHINENIDE